MKKYYLILLIFICSFTFSAESAKLQDVLSKENSFPDFTFESLNGKKTLSTKILDKNKKSLIIMAAEWCPSCQYEMTEVEKFYEKNKTEYNIAVIFINTNSSTEEVKSYLESNKYSFPAYYDSSGVILRETGIQTVPMNIFLDENRKIINVEARMLNEYNFIEEFSE